jgi:hypothetical protein
MSGLQSVYIDGFRIAEALAFGEATVPIPVRGGELYEVVVKAGEATVFENKYFAPADLQREAFKVVDSTQDVWLINPLAALDAQVYSHSSYDGFLPGTYGGFHHVVSDVGIVDIVIRPGCRDAQGGHPEATEFALAYLSATSPFCTVSEVEETRLFVFYDDKPVLEVPIGPQHVAPGLERSTYDAAVIGSATRGVKAAVYQEIEDPILENATSPLTPAAKANLLNAVLSRINLRGSKSAPAPVTEHESIRAAVAQKRADGFLKTAARPSAAVTADGPVTRFAHMSPDAGKVTAILDGKILGAVSLGDVTGYVDVPVGQHTLEVVPEGSTTPALKRNFWVPPGVDKRSVWVIGSAQYGTLDIFVTSDVHTGDPGLALGRVAYFVSGRDDLGVLELSREYTAYELSFPEPTNYYVNIPLASPGGEISVDWYAGNYTRGIVTTPLNQTTVPASSFEAGHSYTFAIAGIKNGPATAFIIDDGVTA